MFSVPSRSLGSLHKKRTEAFPFRFPACQKAACLGISRQAAKRKKISMGEMQREKELGLPFAFHLASFSQSFQMSHRTVFTQPLERVHSCLVGHRVLNTAAPWARRSCREAKNVIE